METILNYKENVQIIFAKKDTKLFKGLIKTDAIVNCIDNEFKIFKKSRSFRSWFFYGEEDIELSHRLKKSGGQATHWFRSKNLSFCFLHSWHELGKNNLL